MAVDEAYMFPGFLTPVLTQLFFPKPPTTFLTCFCRGERQKYAKIVARVPVPEHKTVTSKVYAGKILPAVINHYMEAHSHNGVRGSRLLHDNASIPLLINGARFYLTRGPRWPLDRSPEFLRLP